MNIIEDFGPDPGECTDQPKKTGDSPTTRAGLSSTEFCNSRKDVFCVVARSSKNDLVDIGVSWT